MFRATHQGIKHLVVSHRYSNIQRTRYLPRCCRCAYSQDHTESTPALPKHAQVVICGGGIAGLGVAYHLSKLGLTDVVLLEQGKLTSGTTWHAVGLLGILKKSHFNTVLAKMSCKLYEDLEVETGIKTGLRRCGSMFIAQTKDLMIDLQKRHSKAQVWGIDTELLPISNVQKLLPWMRVDDIEGGLLIKEDAWIDAKQGCLALAQAVRNQGVTIIEGTGIDRVGTTDGRVSSVQTDRGTIECDKFINCAGMWARDVGLASSPEVGIPLQAVSRQFLITKPIKNVSVDGKGPYVRDPDSLLYIQEHGEGLLFGGYAQKGKPVFTDSYPMKADSEFIQLPEDWDHFRHLLEGFLHRVPAAADVQFEQLFNGPESFTPDGEFIMGEAPEVSNYYILAGFNSVGLSLAGGASRLLAELIVNGHTSMDFWPVDVKRFGSHHNSKRFLQARVTEIEGAGYRTGYPSNYSYRTGRKLRCPPLYSRLAQAGAVFGERMGVERPKWFMNADDTDEFALETQRGTFLKPQWFDLVKAEYWACREAVSLMDMSAFTKFEIRSAGNEATMLLQYLCSNDLDCPIGSVVHTGMLNDRGGYENDCSIARIDTNRYFIISPTIQRIKGFHWIKRHLPSDGSVTLKDVTNQYAGLNVLGPKARDVLQSLTSTSLKAADFKPFVCKEINIGFATNVRAMTITHAGEDGMVLYIPNENATQVYDALLDAGKDVGITNAGYYALRWLRIEKFYFYWGEDFDSTTTPFEIGREMRVKFDKGVEFIGKAALLKQREEGMKRRLAGFVLEDLDIDSEVWPWGREPIYRNGQLAGMTTCSSYGPTQGKMICLGWLTNKDETTGELREVTSDFVHKAQYEIDIGGKRFQAKARLYPYQLGAKQGSLG
ncbi:pyruvate dehydrogenase phosphatase regulatory subunit, mitochondrial-like [Asterias amurensis]|uniref:pyruvate dehydrogenase phosphatase regulatory subunit, mitochondrial-like n=1 Tax=Asterias amurensis TaxID=7602 RepID=UPI003AB5C936